jgi:type VI secretion system secreted protein Hcp
MALNAYLSLTLKTQGKVAAPGAKGHGSLAPSKGIEILGFKYEVTTPFDIHSGLLSGKRQHSPVTITREVDSASPLLFHACVTNESFQSATLAFPKSGVTGTPVKENTLELTDGYIAKIGHAPSKGGKRREAVTLVYKGLKVNGAPAATSGGVESYWWRDGW